MLCVLSAVYVHVVHCGVCSLCGSHCAVCIVCAGCVVCCVSCLTYLVCLCRALLLCVVCWVLCLVRVVCVRCVAFALLNLSSNCHLDMQCIGLGTKMHKKPSCTVLPVKILRSFLDRDHPEIHETVTEQTRTEAYFGSMTLCVLF